MKKSLQVLATIGLAGVGCQAQVLLNENFNYSDGSILSVSGGAWTIHSPASSTIPLNIVGGRAFIDQNDSTGSRDDANRTLSQSFNPATDNSSKLYASFTVNFAALPYSEGTATAGSYFAHFKSTAANEFYARVGANTEGASPGTFRLAIANETWANGTTVKFQQDLSLNVDYRVVVRLDLATDRGTLWVNPTSESDTSVTASDVIGYAAGGSIAAYALRQGTTGGNGNAGGPGDLYVDNLLVGLSFADVTPVPEPQQYAMLASLGLLGLAAWRRRAAAKS